jgi:ABC-type dipeptide/oligopeptide/nickel transport system permease subunit
MTPKPRSLWSDARANFVRNRLGMFGLLVFVLLCLTAIFAEQIAPYDPLAQDWNSILKPPSDQHLMGTDEVGRDVFSRVLMGGRTALIVAFSITFISALLGLLIGSLSAFIGGWVDTIMMWITDGLLGFPSIWLAAFVNVATAPTVRSAVGSLYEGTGWALFADDTMISYAVVVFSVGLASWAYPARLVRSQVLSLRSREFIEATRALGGSTWWITLRHLIPNVMGQMIVLITLTFGNAMLFESALSFLGIGIQPPGASWGNMIALGITRVRSHAYLVLMPGLTLALIVLSLQFVGDALNDALNPRSQSR